MNKAGAVAALRSNCARRARRLRKNMIICRDMLIKHDRVPNLPHEYTCGVFMGWITALDLLEDRQENGHAKKFHDLVFFNLNMSVEWRMRQELEQEGGDDATNDSSL